MATIREYSAADERGWLLCRLLSFYDSDYYDDVKVTKTSFSNPRLSLVAEGDAGIDGLIDVEIDGDAATIDSIAVHPAAQRQGIADALLNEVLRRLPRSVKTLDAWTRETQSANGWYQSAGFRESYRYLHIYKGADDVDDGFETPSGLSKPVAAFMHAPIALEQTMRAAFDRVYVCRQYLMDL